MESLEEVAFRGSHGNWLKFEATKAWVPTPCSDPTVTPVSPASEPRGRPWGQLAPSADLPGPPRAWRPGPQRVCGHRCVASQARPCRGCGDVPPSCSCRFRQEARYPHGPLRPPHQKNLPEQSWNGLENSALAWTGPSGAGARQKHP